MIKIEHTLFALPFAFLGAVLAANGLPSAGRSSGSSWRWWARGRRLWLSIGSPIRDIDARNPRTACGHCRRDSFSRVCLGVHDCFSGAFFLAAAMLNRLTLLLAPVALASVLLYSFTKRWTLFSHLVLGWCLAIAPTGAWIAVRGAIDSPFLCCFRWWCCCGQRVLMSFMPVRTTTSIGAQGFIRFPADLASRVRCGSHDLHAAAFLRWFALYLATGLGRWPVGVMATGALLVYQHRLVSADDLSRLNAAFFTTNAFVSVILSRNVWGCCFLHRGMFGR